MNDLATSPPTRRHFKFQQGKAPNHPNISLPPNTTQTRLTHFPAPPSRLSLTPVPNNPYPNTTIPDQDARTSKPSAARSTPYPSLMDRLPNTNSGPPSNSWFPSLSLSTAKRAGTSSQKILGYLPPHPHTLRVPPSVLLWFGDGGWVWGFADAGMSLSGTMLSLQKSFLSLTRGLGMACAVVLGSWSILKVGDQHCV
jgi:hypothetical protein